MIKYSVAMGIRMLCIISLLFVQGWWLFVMAVAAITLPYFAVVIANVGARPGGAVERPGGVVAVRSAPTSSTGFPPDPPPGNGA